MNNNNYHYYNLIHIKMAIFSLALSFAATANHHLYPVILIPGSGGNQLEAKLTPEYKSSSLWCNQWYPPKKDRDGWFRIWFDPGVLLRPITKCFSERMMVYYDPVKDDYHNAPGVLTRVPHFGSLHSLLYLNPNLKKLTSYMEPLVRSLEETGYVAGENLFGAPYDFRYGLAAEGHPCHVASNFLSDLKHLIESATASNGGLPVILLSHSLGGLFALHFLHRATSSWRAKHVKHLITLSAPWGGTVEEMLTFASGNALGVPLVDPLLVRAEQRSSPSNLWLMPSPQVFGTDKPLVVASKYNMASNYTGGDIAQFLEDIGFREGVQPYKTRVLPMVERLPTDVIEDVGVTCVVGSGVTTPEMFYGKGGFDVGPEKVLYGDGDGTVNMASLLALESTAGDGNRTVKVIKVPGVSHTSVLKDRSALERIIEQVSLINSEISACSFVR